MDHELKQRLIGALVVTILSAIFIPMLFDDPIQEEGQAVSNLTLPAENQFVDEPAIKLPANSEQVLAIPQLQAEVIAAPNAQNSLRPDEMDETHALKLQPKPHIAPVVKAHIEKPSYSETTNYGVNADEVDDEPPMKPKLPLKDDTKKSHPEDDLLKQMRAAKLSEIDGTTAPAKIDAPVIETKKVIAPKATPSRWFIQLASLTNKAKAESLLEGLKEQGYPAVLTPIQNEKGTFYRLRVGPELDGKRAAEMKRRMEEQNLKPILVSE
ncbi:MAG: SPOR domain-containing protein [Methylococcaceae bacterium]